jgi:polyisoprenoid-binding protein YceI
MRSATLIPSILLGAAGLALSTFLPSAQEAVAVAPAEVPVFALDPVHSSINFRVMHMQTGYATGRFNEFSGEFAYDPKQLDKSKISFEIQAGSVDTNNGKRDDHLRGSDFFSVEQFPTIAFESTRIQQRGKELQIAGKVKWMGVEKDLAVPAQHVGESQSREGKTKHGFSCAFVLKRSDFGISYGLEGNSLGDEVNVALDLEVEAR